MGKTNIMKATFTIVIAIITSLTIWAGSTSYNPPQYILIQGVDTVNTVQLETVICQESKANISDKSKKVDEIEVDSKTKLEIEQTESPNFLKLFFNFI